MPEDVHELTGKCFAVAKEWAEAADRLWKIIISKAAQNADISLFKEIFSLG